MSGIKNWLELKLAGVWIMQFYVKDIMTENIVSLNDTDSLQSAMGKLVESGIMGAPVLGENENVVGVVSVIDILKKQASHSFYDLPAFEQFKHIVTHSNFPEDIQVKEIMTGDLYFTSPDDEIEKMAKKMYDNCVHRLLVTEYNKLVGIVSTFDLLKLLASSEVSEVSEESISS